MFSFFLGSIDQRDWQRGAIASCSQSEGFHKVSMAVLENFREEVSENDLLLLSNQKVHSQWVLRSFSPSANCCGFVLGVFYRFVRILVKFQVSRNHCDFNYIEIVQ
jgi:hypothetical protein